MSDLRRILTTISPSPQVGSNLYASETGRIASKEEKNHKELVGFFLGGWGGSIWQFLNSRLKKKMHIWNSRLILNFAVELFYSWCVKKRTKKPRAWGGPRFQTALDPRGKLKVRGKKPLPQ